MITVCTNCNQVEPDTHEMSDAELAKYVADYGYEPEDLRVCDGCGDLSDCFSNYPEHDAWEDR